MLCRSLHKTKAVIVMCRSSAPDYSRQRASAFFRFQSQQWPGFVLSYRIFWREGYRRRPATAGRRFDRELTQSFLYSWNLTRRSLEHVCVPASHTRYVY